MYLEFITDVTNEIIQRGIYSDRLVTVFLFFGCKNLLLLLTIFSYRVLQRVFERHIDMNKHRLAEVSFIHNTLLEHD